MANFGHFAGFSIFSPKMRLRLTRNGQFHPIHNFSHLLPPKHLIFWEIQRIFVLGGGYIDKFVEFFNFFESFHTKATQNDPQWPILLPKWLRLARNGQFWLNFNKNLNISAESWLIFTEPSEQGLFFHASRNESKECYVKIKTDKNSNISVESRLICTKPSKQGSFFRASWNESKEWYATIKTDGNLNISAESQLICTSNFFLSFSTF